MIFHHSSGKTRLLMRIFSICIALLMICTFSIPAFATDQAITETDAPPGITYNFYSDGEWYSSQTVKDGETLTEPTAPTVAGKIFEGWFTSEDETAQKFEEFGVVYVNEKAAVDLYAKYQEITETADLPEITYNFYSSGEWYSSQTVKDGETLTEPTAPTVAGKIFEGWFTSEDETSLKFEEFGTVSVTEKAAVDLYAKYQEITETADLPEITYNFYSSGQLYSSQTVKDGETLTEPTAPTAAGKIFEGWFTSEDEIAQKFEAFDTVSVTEKAAVDLYAKWTEQPTNVCDEPKEPSVNLLAGNGGASIPDDDVNFIVVEKKFVGIEEGQIPEGFSITVAPEGGSGDPYVLTQANCSSTAKEADGSIIWRWKITGVGTGTYIVTEENQVVYKYDWTMQGQGLNEEGKVTVEKAKISTFNAELETSCSHTNWPVKMDGDDNFLFSATLTSSNGTAVISRYPLSASQRLAVQEYILKVADRGAWKTPFHFYSIEEQIINGKGFELNGATITYDFANSEVNIGEKNDWKQVMTLKYSVSEANNPEIGITNTYTPSTQDITIKKIVTGPLGDVEKEFQFTYAYTDTDNTYKSDTFKLQNGGTKIISDVPIGTELELKETNASGYATSASYGEQPVSVSGVIEDSEKTMTIMITEGNKLFEVTNHKDVKPDTGIRLESLPYILIFAIVIAGMAVMIVRKCKRRDF